MSYPNIVWLLVDSIRTYPTDADIRGKLPFMERFGREAVEFKTCVTTAPSTIMSITAMMTGLPAYFLARNYEDFRFDGGCRYSLGGVLKEHGYACYAFLRGMDTREKLGSFLDPVPRRYWPDDLRHSEKWRNADLDRILDRVLEAGFSRPAFFFFHYNPISQVETEPDISRRVEATWDRLQRAGLSTENTIVVLCSDHGYPDPTTGISKEWEEATRISHDLVLTDDNILIPLYLRYPGCQPRTIDVPVSSLDLFPTLLELAGLPERQAVEATIDGVSLMPLIESGGREESYPRRFFRCDSRLMLQEARSTAIRGGAFKYIRFHDEHRLAAGIVPQPKSEVLIDLREDPLERRNLLLAEELESDHERVLETFRSEFERSERRGVEFQVDYLLWRQRAKLRRQAQGRDGPPPRLLLAFEPDTAGYLRIGLEAIDRVHPDARVDVLSDDAPRHDDRPSQIQRWFHYARGDAGRLVAPGLERNDRRDASRGPYDLVVSFVQNPSDRSASELMRLAKGVRARDRVVVDCNFKAYRSHNYWYYRLRAFVERLPHVLEDPAILVNQLRSGAWLVKRYLLKKLGRWERWESTRLAPGGDE